MVLSGCRTVREVRSHWQCSIQEGPSGAPPSKEPE
jgi:hypothetical protein